MKAGPLTKIRSEEEAQRLEEFLHALSQPVTGLQCSLELGLRCPHSEEEYRQILRVALMKAEEIAALTGRIRDRLQAESMVGASRDGGPC